MKRKRSSLLTGLIDVIATLAGTLGALVGIRRLANRGSGDEPAPGAAMVDERRLETPLPPSETPRMVDEPRLGTASAPAQMPLHAAEPARGTGSSVHASSEMSAAYAVDEDEDVDENPLLLVSQREESAPPPALAPLRPGWHRPEHMELPAPTYWPAAMAFAITLLAWSLVTSSLIAAVGLVLFVLALAGWIGDLQHEQH